MKILFISLASLLILSSCGEATEKNVTPPTSMIEKAEKPNNEETSDAISLELSSDDEMKYDKLELRVKSGQKVTLVLNHTGKMEKAVMGHNFVLLKSGTDLAEFAMMAMNAKETDYIPDSDAIIVNTKLIGGGESTSITFDAPSKGIYDYICTFPGHYGMMQGKFIVE